MDSLGATLAPAGSEPATAIPPSAPRNGSAAPPAGAGAASRGGCLKVVVDAGVAVVIIDGTPRGRTPYATRMGVGPHVVVARSVSAAYEPGQLAVSIGDGGTTSAVFHRATSTPSP
jgi:hypothetical protein